MPKTKNQYKKIREKSRKTIVNVAMELFAKYGYHNTTISKIAETANISKGLIYNYFKSKDELLEYILFQSFTGIDKSISLNKDEKDPKEKLEIFIHSLFDSLKNKKTIWKLYTSIMLLPELSSKFTDIMNSYNNIFQPLLVELYPDSSDEEIELELIFFGAFIDGIIYDYVIMTDNFPLNKIEKKLIERYCK
ncbi:MAG: TetR/AcrR family transcriptional regulator [Candidatus Marinimicrobia bacterium]|nr:TetR/AcrR family transcriptional regulator [Candidatus Neomarinimicrobiota bacterium]